MFGDPIENPKGWPRVELDEVLDGIDSGKSPVCLSRPATPGEWGVLKLSAVTYGRYNASENKALPEGTAPGQNLEVRPGDLLFSRKNTYSLVGAVVLVRETPKRMLLPDLIFRLRLGEPQMLTASYLHQLLMYPSKRKEVRSLAGGAAGSMPNISKGRLLKLRVEVPPMSLQEEYARVVERLEQHRRLIGAQLHCLEAGLDSLQATAFSARL
ncbi:hypothetical protein [Raineyella fluvialis]|uniref:Type I restriction modification DNA specificity domain-containing protein n=1 Tax=Raineyella fluvialis TaxID=2662261 RepID=A0A5Q2FCL5_9ACTN|nr:hypothetical protein [Raineyella fluvialis]QGF22445.1 hypothetical protein Rai3103_00675 [Raineyella fluvialis]